MFKRVDDFPSLNITIKQRNVLECIKEIVQDKNNPRKHREKWIR
jgi:hypothetical protein